MKKTFIGNVVSNKMINTVVVEITRSIPHPMYGKLIKKTNKLKADTNGMEIAVGQTVKIEETKPMSKDKHFKVVEKIGGKTS
jgi:small subunit ribosomal protein S17